MSIPVDPRDIGACSWNKDELERHFDTYGERRRAAPLSLPSIDDFSYKHRSRFGNNGYISNLLAMYFSSARLGPLARVVSARFSVFSRPREFWVSFDTNMHFAPFYELEPSLRMPFLRLLRRRTSCRGDYNAAGQGIE